MLLKLKCKKFKKIIIGKNSLLILNPNPNLDIQTMEVQILHCIKRPKQWILKSMDFKSRFLNPLILKPMGFKSNK